MNTCTAPTALTAPTDVFARLGNFLVARLGAFDGWLASRRRATQDRIDLAGMSDRELADIGISRGSVDAVADGAWTRDPFR